MGAYMPFEVSAVLKLKRTVRTLKFPFRKEKVKSLRSKVKTLLYSKVRALPHILMVFHVTNQIRFVLKLATTMVALKL